MKKVDNGEHWVATTHFEDTLCRQGDGRSMLTRIRPLVRIRRPSIRCFSIGRMLDMGGMPSGSSDQTLIRHKDASKNSKLQAVAFDFDVLTKSIDQAKEEKKQPTAPTQPTSLPSKTAIQPDLDQIQNVASLLNVSVDTGRNIPSEEPSKKDTTPKVSPTAGGREDIRAKYAAKLKGGLAGIELAKSQVEDTLAKGDAAGHLAARQMAVQKTAASPTKWMALTGTGKLLSYLTHRSIRIALLPNPRLEEEERQEKEAQFMKDFSKQLKDIVVDSVVSFDESHSVERALQKGVLDELGIHPNKVLLVSDKDEYLKTAKDLGMMACRIRPANARRGNVTAHYNTPDVPSVQEVVNDITGISFNAVLNR